MLGFMFKVIGFFVGAFIVILCVYGLWIALVLVHRWVYRNIKSYRNFWDDL
jgi:hypothetical protein